MLRHFRTPNPLGLCVCGHVEDVHEDDSCWGRCGCRDYRPGGGLLIPDDVDESVIEALYEQGVIVEEIT